MSSQDSNFSLIAQVRAPVAAGAWVEIGIPVGAREPWIGLEDPLATMRISATGTENPVTEGLPVQPGGIYRIRGTCTLACSFFVSSSAPTFAVMIFTKN
jgi:hypothetical protein